LRPSLRTLESMPLELKRPIVFFDIESTGLDTQTDKIVELAAVKLFPDGTREDKCKRFNPLIPIPKEATAVHGITDEDVKNEPPFYRVARGDKGIAAFFKNCDLGGFNIVHFDIPLLKKELERAHETLDLTDVAVVDVMKIFKKREPRTLDAAVRFYCNREHEGAHAALADVTATVDVLLAQIERYEDLSSTPEGLDMDARHPEYVDRNGRLRWVNGEAAIAFGRHKGRTLRYMAAEEPDYIRWMIENNVAEDIGHLLGDALIGRFPTKE
jgi:DNA polymerase III subunit epsilon